jgi:hypothetical protein
VGSRIVVAIVVLCWALASCPQSEAATGDPNLDMLCSDQRFSHDPAHPKPVDLLGIDAEFLDTFGEKPGRGEMRAQDYPILSEQERLAFLHRYCDVHPTDHVSKALEALRGHLRELSAAASPPDPNLEAPTDVRDFVVNGAPQMADGRLKDEPDKDRRTGLALGKDATGKIVRIADFTAVYTTILNGAGFPTTDEPLRPVPKGGEKSVADVFIHSEIRDTPPGGNDDKLMRPGVPLFMIGDRGLDVWEIGLVGGVVSVRSVSWSVVGPWEPFQSDRTKYKIYSQRYLDGRTVDEDFADTKAADLVRAACAGDRGGIAVALKNGADANAKGKEGDAPLFWALECGRLDSMEALLKAGADPNYRLDWAGPPTAIAGQPRRYSTLYAAVDDGNLDMVKLLLRFGGDPNTYQDDETIINTALGRAFFDDEERTDAHGAQARDMYETLLDADKDINHADRRGDTIATLALQSRQFARLDELLQRGYNHDLTGLAREFWGYAMLREFPDVPRVVERLKSMGVAVPPRPVTFTMRMKDDGSLDYFGGKGVVHVPKGDPRYDKLLSVTGPLHPGEQKTLTLPENALPI